MKKKLIPSLLAPFIIGGLSLQLSSVLTPIVAESSTEDVNQHEHQHQEHEEHNNEEHHHDHEFEFTVENVVKKEDDHYIMAHGDHFHTIPISELTEEQIAATDKFLAAHPEVTEAYEKAHNIHAGYFENDQVEDRSLEEWAGDWQSVLPYLEDGTLDMVMEKKAESGEKTADEYKEYYLTGYASDVDHLTITKDEITFKKGDKNSTGQYEYTGYEILEYEKGNRGVRFLFTKVEGDEEAPKSIQFSDHNISPTEDLTHFHIFFSNESHQELLKEMDNWPTFYPTEWTADEILVDQLNH
ncbi:ZinT/AdcA family metal-binding protein [Facklamia sp. DSM 111018]|uniref:ZinT/AdcA family metal-binding protein n=1 Tax=Facklamia lactis TaxID=2749967 RepID=A0ABS0LPT9_9LACT|nr:ZinT/AdcA family metal-binding protein [Facklamia lactis]MBG9986163.1 ZinT/AdcA family metal-binding protein [Facklamia lactis]